MFPQNVFPDTARINENGQLLIGGCNTLELAEEYVPQVGRCRAIQQSVELKNALTLRSFLTPDQLASYQIVIEGNSYREGLSPDRKKDVLTPCPKVAKTSR